MGAPAVLAFPADARSSARRRRQVAGCRRPPSSPGSAALSTVGIALAILLASAAGGAGAAAFFWGTPHAEVLNWTRSPVTVRRTGAGAAKLQAGGAIDIASPGERGASGAVHIEVERGFDGARCWATVNAGERVIVVARYGRVVCEPVQGRLAAVATIELMSLYRSDDDDQPRE